MSRKQFVNIAMYLKMLNIAVIVWFEIRKEIHRALIFTALECLGITSLIIMNFNATFHSIDFQNLYGNAFLLFVQKEQLSKYID